jgi:parvulin-like peptidyl-prolyl isomerase
MVEPFENWCFDEGRKEGEVGMVETEFGYHLIYYVGESKLTYRDSMIEAQMITEAMEKWEKELTDAMTATKVNLKGIETDMTMG